MIYFVYNLLEGTMAKLYFRYGAMGSSKSANAIMVVYNYKERNQTAVLLKPISDMRDGEHINVSRCGLKMDCKYADTFLNQSDEELKKYDCIVIDEAQFLTKHQVEILMHISDDLDIPVICYGLRADFQGKLFEGSMYLLAWADTIEEIKTICWCGKKATCNARIGSDGKIVREGPQFLLGGNDTYIPLCRKHFRSGQTKKEE
jgi:thymidine kinase